MASQSSINQQNINLGFNMSWRLNHNLDFLQKIAEKVKGAEAKEKAAEIVSLYRERRIPQSRTAEKIIYELKEAEPNKQKFALKRAEKVLKKYRQELPITRRLKAKTDMKIAAGQPVRRRLREKTSVSKKKQIVGEKIVKLFRNRLTFRITEENAFRKNIKTIILEPTSVGSVPASSLDVFAARSYLIARRRIPKDAHFRIYASCSLEVEGAGKIPPITSKSFDSKELNKFLKILLIELRVPCKVMQL